MDSNNINTNYGEGEQQLRKRKFNELANDSQLAAEGEEEDQPPENLSKKKCEEQGNDALKNLHLENLSREDLIQLVQEQLANQNEAHNKQLETVKKEAEESAKKQAKQMSTKMEELQMALLASQQKVEQLTKKMENLNVEHQNQKHLDSAKQAEEFAKRIVQLEKEKAEFHAELDKKVAEIVDKSEEVAEKAKQIDALLIQLKESSHQHQIGLPVPVPNEQQQQMKIQLSLETWYDWLTFVPRHRLGQIVPKVGDRKFASIIQKFLHKYGEIMIGGIQIVAPYEEDPNGHPRVRALQNKRQLRFEIAEAQMPANITNFKYFKLRYFDQSVLNFFQKFKQNGLLDNVNLYIAELSSKDIVQPVLSHLLPLINGIVTVDVADSAQLVDFYDAGNSKNIYEMNMKMMEKTRFLGASYGRKNLDANKIDLYCRWLYQPARADWKPRLLILGRSNVDYSPISLFIDRLKQDFLMATDPATFMIRIDVPKAFQLQEDICMDNGKTKERLVTKMDEVEPKLEKWEQVVLMISRYPLASTKKWIAENEKEVLIWDLSATRRIYLSKELKVVQI